MAKDMCTVKYVDDDGGEWCIWADKATIEAAGNGADLGATATGGSLAPIPRWLKPRYVFAKGGTTDAVRKVICYTKNAAMFTTPGTTIQMSPYRGTGVATEVFTRDTQSYNERKYHKKGDDPTIA